MAEYKMLQKMRIRENKKRKEEGGWKQVFGNK